MDYKQQASLTTTTPSYKQAKLPSGTGVIRQGSVTMRKRTTFGGATWKPRRLELESQTLTIINPVNNKRVRIELRDVTELERTDLADHCLRLRGRGKLYNFSFGSDPELYDWQDDIYQRCPLGNYSAPFDFVHKSHIGSDNVTGTFTDPNILPIYAEIVSGQTGVAKVTSGVVVAPRSRPTSIALPLNAKPIQKALPASTPGSALLEGSYLVKHSRFFASWVWRDRWLSVTPQSLVIHRGNIKNSLASKNIPLINLTRMEPDEKREACLVVEYSSHRQTGPRSQSTSSPAVANSRKDTVWILFKSYDELYTWRDTLYDRSSLSSPIGNPTGFVHNTHVGFDPDSGAFTGLPNEWQSANPSPSNPITRTPSSPTSGKLRRPPRRRSSPNTQA